MGFFSWLAGSDLETRAYPPPLPLTSAELMTVLSPGSKTVSGVEVSEASAPSLTAVWRAVSLLSGVVAGLPLKAYTGEDDARTKLPSPLLKRPHPTFTRFELIELVMVHLLLNGNAYMVKVRNGLGEVVALLPVAPNLVVPNLSDDGVKSFEVPGKQVPRVTVGSDVILHIPGMGYDGRKGWSPIGMCRQSLSVGMAAEEFSARFFGNGSHLGGLVTAEGEVTPEQAQEAKKHWRENTAGLAKAHEVAVLQKGFKYQALGIPPRDAQLIESRQFSVQEIARLFGVANWMLNEAAGSTSWGSGLAEQTKGLLTFTLQSWLSRIEDRLTAELMPPDSYVEFTRAGLLHTTTKERYDSYHVAILAGFMTPNECRALENLPSLQEPDADLLAAPKARPRAT